jgi:hypothetical protein
MKDRMLSLQSSPVQPGAAAHTGSSGSSVRQVLRVRPTMLPSHKGTVREPPRPAHLRGLRFEDEYDFETLFYDHFYSASDNKVVLLGPAFHNLAAPLGRMEVMAVPSYARCRFCLRELDRHGQVWVSVPSGTERLRLRVEFAEFDLDLRPDMAVLFDQERVIFTLSRNNRLDWIQDWVRYNRDIHGATAVLIYDNASTRYSSDELVDALNGLSGIRRACVVEWPFKYGPQGWDTRQSWDSDYCQHGALEHARHYLLAKARSVLNSDIDEFVVSARGRGVFEAVEQSYAGAIRYHGVWVPGLSSVLVGATSSAAVRHRDFSHYLRLVRTGPLRRFGNRCPTKWAAVPSRCPADSQWTTHSIKHWILGLPTTREFVYRHFQKINDNWKYDRSRWESFDPTKHAYDSAAVASYARVDWDL